MDLDYNAENWSLIEIYKYYEKPILYKMKYLPQNISYLGVAYINENSDLLIPMNDEEEASLRNNQLSIRELLESYKKETLQMELSGVGPFVQLNQEEVMDYLKENNNLNSGL